MTGLCLLTACSDSNTRGSTRAVASVEVVEVQKGSIRAIRTFSGFLEPRSSFTVYPKVSARVEAVHFDLSDSVLPEDTLIQLDPAEYEQSVLQAEAELQVAKANLAQAEQSLEIAGRTFERAETLRQRGVTSEADFDDAKNTLLSREANVAVYTAQKNRAEADLASARIQLSYTEVKGLWKGASAQRIVSERYVDEGQVVSENDPLLEIVDVSVLSGIFYVAEKDYARLGVGQSVDLYTEAFPRQRFPAQVARIAPIFQESSRQARVELTIPNEEGLLKPGMFIRADVEVDRAEQASIVPESSIVRRAESSGVFMVGPDGASAVWTPVEIGIREGSLVEVIGPGLNGRVITLGQQQIDDGSAISIVVPST